MERVYVIPLRKAYRASRPRRSEKAIKVIREFLERHTKPSVLKLHPSINEEVWKRGIEKPPRKIKVVVDIKEEKGSRIVEARLFGVDVKKTEEKKEKQEEKTETPNEVVQADSETEEANTETEDNSEESDENKKAEESDDNKKESDTTQEVENK